MIFYMLGILGYYKARNKPVPAGICIAFFLVVAVPPITALYLLLNKHWVFQVIALVAGWFCWTFIEYFIRRFWMDKKDKAHYHESLHFIHHTNPRVIFTSEIRRLLFAATAILFIYISIQYSTYLFLPAGIVAGFALYSYMHVWLHKPAMSRWIGRHQDFHMQHHCGKTEDCFGVTVTWWDKIFNTNRGSEKNISQKTREFYFRENETQKELVKNL